MDMQRAQGGERSDAGKAMRVKVLDSETERQIRELKDGLHGGGLLKLFSSEAKKSAEKRHGMERTYGNSGGKMFQFPEEGKPHAFAALEKNDSGGYVIDQLMYDPTDENALAELIKKICTHVDGKPLSVYLSDDDTVVRALEREDFHAGPEQDGMRTLVKNF